MTAADVDQWSQDVLPFVWNEAPPPQNEAELPGLGFALLSADTDRTQSYVFQSARLPEIRGASMLLDDLNRHRLLELLAVKGLPTGLIAPPHAKNEKGCVVYVGGGSLLALVPLNLAEELCREIETLYPRESGAATITAVFHPITVAEIRGQWPAHFRAIDLAALTPDQQARVQLGKRNSDHPLQNFMRRQTLLLRARKQSKTAVPHFETSPFARVCNSCARRPATNVEDGLPGEGPRYLCQVCYANGRRGRHEKSEWHRRWEDWCQDTKGEYRQAPQVEDLSVIGKASDRYIGYIHADGNGIGHFLEQAHTLPAYSQRSQALAQATETAVFEAIYAHLRQQNQTTAPFEIITIGGDDVLLIVPAYAALPLARDICRGFSDQLAARLKLDNPPTMSAGVVIAQESNPIYFVHELSHQLLKSAKKGTHKKETGCLDYMVLKSQSTVAATLKDVRHSPYLRLESKLDNERAFLTGRPYTLDEAAGLWESVQRLKQINFSPGQLHQIRREFGNGRFPAIFYYLYQRARLGDADRKALQAIEEDWGMVTAHNGAPPWRAAPKKAKDGFDEYDTPFVDMLDLLPFAPERKK